MNNQPPGEAIVLKTTRSNECFEARLVLMAAGVAAEAVSRDGTWLIIVDPQNRDAAISELEAYRDENNDRTTRLRTADPVFEGSAVAVFLYCCVLMLVAVLAAKSTFGMEWFEAGRMHAGSVVAGQWWRMFTALTLHLDAAHLMGNLLFGAVFGLLAGRSLGGGVAWLGIVIAGGMGNGMNAWAQPAAHTSIGASTAVFAALGIIVSHGLRRWAASQEKPFKRWSPLIGGVLLLAFTGVGGERTDVLAHVTGFVAGLMIGWAGSRLPNRWLAARFAQNAAGAAAIALIVLSWTVALAAVR
ncbi:rhomboid family intramembrane serine protease [Novipirellula maiorica]|nr:rhomboid family intramembrane serine protease [Rhodopirellula maiorica]